MAQKIRMGGNDLIVNDLYINGTSAFSSGTQLSSAIASTLASTTITFADARIPVTTASSNGTTITNQGLTVISTTGGTAHTLSAPVAGCRKILVSTNATTVDVTVAASTTVTINGGENTLVFDGANEVIELVGASATAWYIVSNAGTVGVTS